MFCQEWQSSCWFIKRIHWGFPLLDAMAPRIKFRPRGPKSEPGPLLWNIRYVFFYKVEKVGHPTHFFSNIPPLKNMSRPGPRLFFWLKRDSNLGKLDSKTNVLAITLPQYTNIHIEKWVCIFIYIKQKTHFIPYENLDRY